MKYLVIILALIVLAASAYWAFARTAQGPMDAAAGPAAPASAAVPADGTYTVLSEESRVSWAGKKPLIDGYVNTGSIAISEGTVTVAGEEATGAFTLDLDTLSVSATPTKPGQENALEGHLKGARWFDVATYPTATFVIERVTPRESGASHAYDIAGSLTLKGQTHPVAFPATIYADADGRLRAEGTLDIDRTQWGITAGSASFFDSLADNAIDDMVALSFSLVAVRP